MPQKTAQGWILRTKLFSLPEVVKVIQLARRDGAPGPNGIPNSIYKENTSYWGAELGFLFNCAILNQQVPDNWKDSILTPIYKSGAKDAASNYRIITLLDCEAKYFASLLLSDLRE